jgi:hypothetical protein
VTASCVHPGIVRARLIRDRDGLITSKSSSSRPRLAQLTSQTCLLIATKLQMQCSSWHPSSSRQSLRCALTSSTNTVNYSSTPDVCSLYSVPSMHVSEHSFLHQAAATTCYVAVHPAVAGVSGKYFADCNEAAPSRLGASSEEASKLWSFSDAITAEKASVHAAGCFRFQQVHRCSDADRVPWPSRSSN